MPGLSISGESNIPEWKEDERVSVNSKTSVTHSLSNDYDQVLIKANPSKIGFNELRVNGVSTSSYDHRDRGENITSSDNKFAIDRAQNRVKILISRDSFGNITMSCTYAGGSGGAVTGDCSDASPPINQFTLRDNNNTARDTELKIYGWIL